ncbi:hypothetical protein [Streptomyces cacaoi]|uniref:Uncharacterized protein n=1 Tax=Streptomyces cacaoi TaxID=1898 RepID=A0A4Y3QUW2_STRCI|nr:hypothetical protein [Streptomyces cacaoi]GEB49194.1 hypothetical protein SCA03_17450 [Streptomyces cacaoi]
MGRPPKDRAANAQLDYWLRRAGFSNRELARAVTGRAAQEGERHVHPDESRVRRWRARGETPRAPVPRLIADLLSERVGTRLSIADIGMTPAHRPRPALARPEHHHSPRVPDPERTHAPPHANQR